MMQKLIEQLMNSLNPLPHGQYLKVRYAGGDFWGSPHLDSSHDSGLYQINPDALPVAQSRLEGVMCVDAAHHMADLPAFLAETYRILKPQGQLGILDTHSSPSPKIARYTNLFEQLRDPTHHQAYSSPDWELYLEQAGFKILHQRRVKLELRVGEWAYPIDPLTLRRLRVMLIQAPRPIKEWYGVHWTADMGLRDVLFSNPHILLIAQKP